MKTRPHILLVIPRGEAVRNFLYSDTLKVLKQNARVTVLTVVYDDELLGRIGALADEIIPLKEFHAHPLPAYLRTVIENAHDRRLWSKVAQNNWELRDRRARQQGKQLQRGLVKATIQRLANNPCLLDALSSLERYLHWKFRATREFDDLFTRLKPDLGSTCSHVNAPAGELPLRVARRMGIKTAGFIFSWDNLTSRNASWYYDYWLVWHESMKRQLLSIYPRIQESDVIVTGTPQFDFHFKPDRPAQPGGFMPQDRH